MQNTDQARVKIEAKLKKLTFQSNRKYGIILIVLIILMFGLMLFFALWTFKTFNFMFLIGVFASAPCFIGLFIFVALKSRLISQKNQKVLKLAQLNLHQTFFDNIQNPFPNTDFKFEGISPSSIYKTNCLKFTLNGETIHWNIDEDVETRHRGHGDDEESYTVYILKFTLNSSAEKLSGLHQITMTRNSKLLSFFIGKNALFQSESIEFNNKFRVESYDQMEAYKIFSPKIIDRYLASKFSRFFQGEMITLKNKEALINQISREEREFSWVPDPLNFSHVRWDQKHAIDDIFAKIELDFQRFFDAQELLMPLDLYHSVV